MFAAREKCIAASFSAAGGCFNHAQAANPFDCHDSYSPVDELLGLIRQQTKGIQHD